MITYAQASLKGPMACGEDGVFRVSYSGVGEMIADATEDYGQNDSGREMIRKNLKEHAGDDWANGHRAENLSEVVSQPDQQILDAIEALKQELISDLAIPQVSRRKVRRGLDWGDELDADRFLQREPNAWERSVREQTAKQTVTIALNAAVSWDQRPAELLYRGAAALALADLLSQRGTNVQILCFLVIGAASTTMGEVIGRLELKAADMPLDTASIAAAVCDIGVARMGMVHGMFRHVTGRLNQSLGHPRNLPEADRQQVDYFLEQTVTSREAAANWIRSQLAADAAKEV